MTLNKLLTRRQSLFLGLGALASISALTQAKSVHLTQRIRSLNDLDRNFAVHEEHPLRERAAAKGLIYGAAGRSTDFNLDPLLTNSFIRECSMLVPEWELKWADTAPPLRPGFHQFDFTYGDQMLAFAQTHGMLMRGHTLVWHLSIPEWFQETVNTGNVEQLLTSHIRTVVGCYRGKIHSWDVVNEAVEVSDMQADSLRRSPWFELMGASYIDLAFRIAAETDPDALLVYNDYGLEYDSYQDEAKRVATLRLLERLKASGTPIHALGIQSHLIGDATHFNAEKFRSFLADVASMGLKILITELDVIDQKLPADIETRDRIIAAAYEEYLNVALNEPAVIAVLTWGLSDRSTWHSQFYPRPDGLPVRPLPLDENMNRKPAWYAIARAFDQAPVRTLTSL